MVAYFAFQWIIHMLFDVVLLFKNLAAFPFVRQLFFYSNK